MKNQAEFKLAQMQLIALRTMMALSLIAFIIICFRHDPIRGSIVSADAIQTLLTIKYFVYIFVVIYFATTFIVPRMARTFPRYCVYFYLLLFYALCFDEYLYGLTPDLAIVLLIIAVFGYFSLNSNTRMVIFAVMTNAWLIGLTVMNNDMPALQFTMIYAVASFLITISKLIQNRLNLSVLRVDRFFEEIFNTMRDAVLLFDPKNNRIVFSNKSAVKLFGGNSEIINNIIPEYRATFNTAIKMIFEFKGNWEGEIKMIDTKKRIFFAIVSLNYFKANAEELLFMKVVDITKVKDADEQLKQALLEVNDKNSQLEETKKAIMNILEDVVSEREEAMAKEQKLNAVMQSIAEGVIVFDSSEHVYLCNDAFLKMLQITNDEIAGKTYPELLDFRDEVTNESLNSFIDNVYKGQMYYSLSNFAIKRKNGTLLAVNLTASPVYNDQKQVQRVVLVIRDGTEQRKIDKMRSEFVSIASHQLRTPLTSINWYVELLEDPDSSANLTRAQKESIARIGEGNKRMIELVNDLLNISRIETGKNFNLQLSQVDYVKLIEEAIEEVRITASKNNIQLKFDKAGIETLILNIDPGKISQVVMNILSNAIKYSHPDSEVLLRFGRDDEFIYLDVVDHGIGIPEDQQERVFEKFFRAANAVTQQTEGTGLGMYIGRSIAKLHGGDVSFYSKLNEGTTFTLKLPLHWSPAPVQTDQTTVVLNNTINQ